MNSPKILKSALLKLSDIYLYKTFKFIFLNKKDNNTALRIQIFVSLLQAHSST